VETTKKTSTTRAALLVLAALSMLLSGLFIATASRSDANPPSACPDGFSLTADAKNCFQAAVVTSADNPNSCDSGQLTPDGTKCYVAARVIPQEGQTLCPKGYSPDDSLGSMCARFDAATQRADTCPAGSRGVAGGCYILVAKGPRGAAACDEGVVVGTNCVITGDAPVNGTSSCPVSATVIQTGGECYTLIAPPTGATSCVAPYIAFGSICKQTNDGADEQGILDFACDAAPQTIVENMRTHGGLTKIDSCDYVPVAPNLGCPDGTTADTNGVDCRRPVDLRPGAKVCSTGFGIVDGKCIRYEATSSPSPQCPAGSVEDGVGDCRKPVADASGAYYCKDANAALNGKSCVWTAGFLIEPSPTLYKCDAGARTVIGSGSATDGTGSAVQVICILGDSNANTGSTPSCLQGVLSTDNAYCIVPRIDTAPAAVAAPVPSFTG
jgi:hypothetical protein